MTTVTRYIGFTNGIQRLNWNGGAATITAHLWGGGGGAGGNDSRAGGNGTGGGYSSVSFNVSAGDIIDVAVGGQGSNGQSGVRGTGGGSAGAGYLAGGQGELFNTRTAIPNEQPPLVPAVYAYSNSAYCSFLNTYGVWQGAPNYVNFNRTYSVNFPTSGVYTFTFSTDNYGYVTIDGQTVISRDSSDPTNYQTSIQVSTYVSAGNHELGINAVNTGGAGSVALTVSGGLVFSGGRGGNAGFSGTSGGGGGGGGATVVLLNNSVIAVAGGGGGGGGGGRNSNGQSAPGPNGQASSGIYAGQNGDDLGGDSGGGGGGGGGLRGGNGGGGIGGDNGAYAGFYGAGDQSPTGVSPANSSSPFYRGGEAYGGTPTSPATAGLAAIVITTEGTSIHYGGQFVGINQTYVNVNGVWKPTQGIYVKDNYSWKSVVGTVPPPFYTIATNIGVNSRTWP